MPRESPAEERMTAVAQAHTAFRHVRTSTSDERGRWLVGIAEALEEHRSALVAVADEETALGAGRLNGELDRTIHQLHHFRNVIAQEKHLRAIDQPLNIEGARSIGMVCVHLDPTNPEAGFIEARRLLGLEPR